MRRTSVSRWVVGVLATMMLAACSTDGEAGSVSLSLTVDGVEVTSVQYSISGGALGQPLEGTLAVENDQVFQLITNLPVGVGYVMTLTASNDGVVVCNGTSAPFDIADGQTTEVDIVLVCGETPVFEGGDVNVNASFDVQALNACPVVHSYTAIPSSIPENGDSAVEVVASDPNGGALSYSWSATGGSFDNSGANDPVYTCDLAGPQTLSVVISDGDPSCDLTVDITVGCGGAILCEGVVCADTGNECTANACDPQDGSCKTANVANGTSCAGGEGSCQNGDCSLNCAGVNCDDGNECTVDSCEPATGQCNNVGLDDSSPCAAGAGICQAGSCSILPTCADLDCDDGNPCTVDVCDSVNVVCVAPPQPETDGTACGANATCQAGVCTGNAPDGQTVSANVNCPLPLGLGVADVNIELALSPVAAWTPNGTVTVGFSATALLPASLGDLLIGLGTDQINIDSLVADLTLTGGTPTPITVSDAGLSFDVDANDDGTAEDVTIIIAVPDTDVTNDGAATVDFTVGFFEVQLSGVPLLGNLVVTSDDSDPNNVICTLSSTTASFPAN